MLIANNTDCSSCYDEICVIMGGVGLGGVGRDNYKARHTRDMWCWGGVGGWGGAG